MDAFSTYLKNAIHHESTHEFILEILLRNFSFRKKLLNIDQENIDQKEVLIKRQPEKGLFDLSLKVKEDTIAFFEIKMWSNLSDNQLERQAIHAIEFNIPVYYILLGTSTINHLKNRQYNFLIERIKKIKKLQDAKINENNFIKISYNELLFSMEDFSSEEKGVEAICNAYKKELKAGKDWLFNYYKKEEEDPFFNSYSRFFQLQKCLPGLNTQIKFLDTRGRTEVLMTDNGTWLYFEFEDKPFLLFQEFHQVGDFYEHQIVAQNVEGKKLGVISKNLKTYFQKNFKENLSNADDWTFNDQSWKWITLARRETQLNNKEDFKKEANWFEKINKELFVLQRKFNSKS